MIYLDNASTTEVSEDYRQIINRYLYDTYANAGSIHRFGNESKQAIENARKEVAKAININSENVIFTSSGSEANNLAILGLERYFRKSRMKHIITTKYEHHSVLNSMKELEKRGYDVTYLDVPDGIVRYSDFVKAVRKDTVFASIMYVNNELGTENDIKSIYDFCKNHCILFHSDCVQAMGMKNINMDIHADLVSISGHKIHAPKGVGCLCVKEPDLLTSIIFGGEQEFGLRAGTENVAFIAVFGEAMCFSKASRMTTNQHIECVKSAFVEKFKELCEKELIKYSFHVSSDVLKSKICSIGIEGVDAETLVIMLGDNGVCVSAGAACSSHSSEPSHVLKAIGLSDKEARETIRVSFSSYNTVEEVQQAAQIIVNCVKELRELQDENSDIDQSTERFASCIQTYIEDDKEYWTEGRVYEFSKNGDTYEIETNYGGYGKIGKGYMCDCFEEYFEKEGRGQL